VSISRNGAHTSLEGQDRRTWVFGLVSSFREKLMLGNQKCRSVDELKNAILGKSSASVAAEIEEHLEGCSICIKVIEGFDFQSQIVDALKMQPATSPLDVPADLEQLMTHLDTLQLGAESSDSALGDYPILARDESSEGLGRLAHYRVIELLGAGGMGVVYRADDTKLKRSVALKVLRPRIAQGSEARARFLHEAQAVASIKHEHVVVIYEVGEAATADGGSIPYLAMELLEGVSLQAWMREQPRPSLLTVVRLARQTAEALAALHSRGLVHRDVKPANIWLEPMTSEPTVERSPDASLEEAGKVKLLDFGLAARPSDVAFESRALGTPAYMAPRTIS